MTAPLSSYLCYCRSNFCGQRMADLPYKMNFKKENCLKL